MCAFLTRIKNLTYLAHQRSREQGRAKEWRESCIFSNSIWGIFKRYGVVAFVSFLFAESHLLFALYGVPPFHRAECEPFQPAHLSNDSPRDLPLDYRDLIEWSLDPTDWHFWNLNRFGGLSFFFCNTFLHILFWVLHERQWWGRRTLDIVGELMQSGNGLWRQKSAFSVVFFPPFWLD